MSNAWFYYLIPLAFAVIFVGVGANLFRHAWRGDRDAKGNKYPPSAGCGGALFAGVGALVGLGILLTSPPPWQRQRLFDHVFHTPPERIERFVIRPAAKNAYKPLTTSQVVVDDPALIGAIATSLRSAREISPNHPNAKWTADVEMVTRDGTYYFAVRATVPGDRNGTLVNVSPKPGGGGWNLGDAKADGLDRLLEDATKAQTTR